MTDQLTTGKIPNITVIGIGNDYRRDDSVGLLIAREVAKQTPEDVRVMEAGADPWGLIESWTECDLAIVVDAVMSGTTPGTVYRFEVSGQPLPADLFPHYSTHGLNVAQVIELARVLEKLPPRMIVYGIEGGDYDEGVGLSDDVAAAAARVSHSIVEYVRGALKEDRSLVNA